jgi:protein TonB
MSRDLFSDVVSPRVQVRSTPRYTILISIVAHAVVLAAVVIVPLMASNVLPAPAIDRLDFMPAEPLPPMPPSPPPSSARPVRPQDVVNRDAAPTVQPTEIGEEVPHVAPGDNFDPNGIDLGPASGGGIGGGDDVGLRIQQPAPVPLPAPQKPVRVGGQIREPVKVKNVAPVYPAIAATARVTGTVIIDAVIGTDGAVRDVRILSGVPLLNQAAVDAVRQWRYTPTLLNNTPVQVIMTVTIKFGMN